MCAECGAAVCFSIHCRLKQAIWLTLAEALVFTHSRFLGIWCSCILAISLVFQIYGTVLYWFSLPHCSLTSAFPHGCKNVSRQTDGLGSHSLALPNSWLGRTWGLCLDLCSLLSSQDVRYQTFSCVFWHGWHWRFLRQVFDTVEHKQSGWPSRLSFLSALCFVSSHIDPGRFLAPRLVLSPLWCFVCLLLTCLCLV